MQNDGYEQINQDIWDLTNIAMRMCNATGIRDCDYVIELIESNLYKPDRDEVIKHFVKDCDDRKNGSDKMQLQLQSDEIYKLQKANKELELSNLKLQYDLQGMTNKFNEAESRYLNLLNSYKEEI